MRNRTGVIVGAAPLVMALALLRGEPGWKVRTGVSEELAAGIRRVEREVSGPAKTTLHLVFFDETKARVAILDQPERKSARRISEVLGEAGAIAGCNGGYYDLRDFSPAGLQIIKGRHTGKLDAASLHNGVVMVEKGTAAIRMAQEIKSLDDVTDLAQCSPLLVYRGRQVFGSPSDTGKNTRTFIATDGKGKWLIGTCKNVTLTEIARLLASPNVIPELVVSEALNLDGGPSSGLWCRTRGGEARYVAEASRVKNMVAVLPK